MSELLIFCLCTSLKITAIHVCCLPGGIFSSLANEFTRVVYKLTPKNYETFEKPLFSCLPCMASVWGFGFWLMDGMNYDFIEVVLIVCGINAVIEKLISECHLIPLIDEKDSN